MSERISGDILKGHLPMVVLATLAGRARHGYDIMRTLSERSDGVLELGQGTIYPLLYTLEEQGLIQSYEEVVEGRRRRVYSLTSTGRRSLTEQREIWDTFQRAINRVLKTGLEPA